MTTVVSVYFSVLDPKSRMEMRSKPKTRESAIADKPRNAFRGQSWSANMVPFHIISMVSYYCPTVIVSVRSTVLRYSTSKML